MIVAVTGTRHGMTDVQKCMFEGLLRPMKEFHHGSCQGVDVEAARIVHGSFIESARPMIVAHPGPDNDPHVDDSHVDDLVMPGRRHFVRNRLLVELCDELFALPGEKWENDVPPKRGGTAYTVSYARKLGKKVTIIYPDGTLA